MKHPALLRALAVCLLLCSLLTLFAGALALVRTRQARQAWQARAARWEENAAEAQRLADEKAALRADYDAASAAWPAREERHETQRASYRMALATYSATKAGIKLGRPQLESAAAELNEAVRAFQQGMALFLQSKAALEPVYTLYQTLQEAVAQAQRLYGENGTAPLTVEDALTLAAQTHEFYAQIDALLAGLETQTPEDQHLAAEALRKAAAQMNEVNGTLAESGVEQLAYTVSRSLYDEASALLENPPEGLSGQDARAAADALCRESLGLSFDELGDWLEQNEPAPGDGDTPPSLPPELLEQLSRGMPDDRSLIETARKLVADSEQTLREQEAALRAEPENSEALALLSAAIREGLQGADRLLALIGPTVEDAWAKIELTQRNMNLAWQALEQGQQAVKDGLAELDATEKKLAKQFVEFKLRRFSLQNEQLALEKLREAIERYETLTAQERRVRDALFASDAVYEAVRCGAPLAASAREALAQEDRAQTLDFRLRAGSGGLLLAAALCGLFAACVCFEKPKLRRLWPPLALTALLAAAGEALSLAAGRGLWYTGLFVLVFSAAALPFCGRRPTT